MLTPIELRSVSVLLAVLVNCVLFCATVWTVYVLENNKHNGRRVLAWLAGMAIAAVASWLQLRFLFPWLAAKKVMDAYGLVSFIICLIMIMGVFLILIKQDYNKGRSDEEIPSPVVLLYGLPTILAVWFGPACLMAITP